MLKLAAIVMGLGTLLTVACGAPASNPPQG